MSTKRTAISALVVLAGCACLGAVKLVEDDPPAPRPQPGGVTGKVNVPRDIVELWAVSRVTGKTYKPASCNPRTGEFRFGDLPGDATYDLRIKLDGGRVVEGIDLEFVDARMVRLAALRRRQLGLPPERTHKFSMDDVAALEKYVRDMDDFMEVRRVLYIRGHGRRVTMLVELMRTRDFHAAEGNIIWRVELWYFVNQFGGWERLGNQERLLRRLKTTPDEWRKVHVEYYPRLSAYVDPRGKSAPVSFKIPAKPDASRGRVAGTDPEIDGRPHILGLDAAPEAATRPRTRPAGQ